MEYLTRAALPPVSSFSVRRNMRFAVLGAAGQLGSELVPRLPGEVLSLGRADIDLARPQAIAGIIPTLRVDVFINCAAYNFVDRAETETEAAFAVNAFGVRALARACRESSVRLVHFSSDHVFGFDESRRIPLSEVDLPGPVNVYGLSKLAGEYMTRAECPESLVIRTCGLYGAHGSGGKGRNFVQTMLRLAREGIPIKVVSDQRCTPSSAGDVAEAVVALIDTSASGIVHITNSGDCSWYEFAAEIFRQTGLKPNLTAVASSEWAAKARRPAYSVLSNLKVTSLLSAPPRPWQAALAAYLQITSVV